MDDTKDFLLVIIFFIALGVVWVLSGGPGKESARNLFILPPAPFGEGGTFALRGYNGERDGASMEEKEDPSVSFPIVGEKSSYAGKIYFEYSKGGAQESLPQNEYIRIRADRNNNESILISGWKLSSPISKREMRIEDGVVLPRSDTVQIERPIALSSGERAIITTGRSPVGVSFKTNKCTGYFEQFQDFNPKLRLSCPYPEDELAYVPVYELGLDGICVDFVEDIPRCTMPLSGFPSNLSQVCSAFITETINYTGCITNHQNDGDFYGDEWRIFLGRSEELWREKREIIVLTDQEGKIVDTYSY